MSNKDNLQQRAINTIRFLSADGVQKANSGHPGLPMGTAAIAYTVWTRHLKINPANPEWVGPGPFYFVWRAWLNAAIQHALSFRI